MKYKNLIWLIVSLAIIVADQLSKYSIVHYLSFQQTSIIIPHYFNFYLTANTGAAFSLLAKMAGWQRWFFSGVALIIVVVLLKWLVSLDKNQYWFALAISLIIGGAIGNLIDRLRLSYVVDFIQVHYDRYYYYPTFNVADSAVVVGAVILAYLSFFRDKT